MTGTVSSFTCMINANCIGGLKNQRRASHWNNNYHCKVESQTQGQCNQCIHWLTQCNECMRWLTVTLQCTLVCTGTYTRVHYTILYWSTSVQASVRLHWFYTRSSTVYVQCIYCRVYTGLYWACLWDITMGTGELRQTNTQKDRWTLSNALSPCNIVDKTMIT